MENRRTLGGLRASLDQLLEWFALVESLPARRADDPALRDAIREARPHIATLLAVLERMDRPGGEAREARPGGEQAARGLGAE